MSAYLSLFFVATVQPRRHVYLIAPKYSGGWHEQIGDPTLADAIIDRIVQEAYQIVIEGTDSMRKRTGIQIDLAESQ